MLGIPVITVQALAVEHPAIGTINHLYDSDMSKPTGDTIRRVDKFNNSKSGVRFLAHEFSAFANHKPRVPTL